MVRLEIIRAKFPVGKSMVIDINDKQTFKNLMKKRKEKVLELIRIFNRAFLTRGIIAPLL
jgi:hypothetical protein